MGSVASAKWRNFGFIPVGVIIVAVAFLFQTRTMNVMMLGDEPAITLGINLKKYRAFYMILASLLTGSS
jgi:iron complex transport system permease protein